MTFSKLERIGRAVALAAFATGTQAATDIASCQIILQPGSYRVTQNLISGGICLDIRADRVSIDLGGHEIVGPGTNGGAGLRASLSRRQVAVRNGTVSNFNVGVDFGAVAGSTIENVHVTSVFDGIRAGPAGIVRGNVVRGALRLGITVSDDQVNAAGGSVITDNVVEGSGQNGIEATERGSVARGNAVTRSANVGIFVQCPSAVIGNAAHSSGTPSNRNLVLFGTGCVSSQNSTAP